jgi:ubiquinone/menaquinone biosynthesis C-methylase UbiE
METKREPLGTPNVELKACCANVYQSDWARLILGDSFHPGGMGLTERLGTLLALKPGMRLLDVAAGQGASAIYLAQQFGCAVLGVDYGGENVRKATEAASTAGVGHLVSFQQGDAERLTVEAASFDAVICECAFCTFPSKRDAANEFQRVLKPGSRVGLSDLTRFGAVPEELQGVLAWIACIADAQPLEEYVRYLRDAGLTVDLTEAHHNALGEMVQEIRAKLLGAELLVKLKKIDLPNVNFEQGKSLARAAAAAIQAGTFGYAVVLATKPRE